MSAVVDAALAAGMSLDRHARTRVYPPTYQQLHAAINAACRVVLLDTYRAVGTVHRAVQ